MENAKLHWEGRKENRSSERSIPLCHSMSAEIMCLDTASFSVFGES